jgi:hypothetical protein
MGNYMTQDNQIIGFTKWLLKWLLILILVIVLLALGVWGVMYIHQYLTHDRHLKNIEIEAYYGAINYSDFFVEKGDSLSTFANTELVDGQLVFTQEIVARMPDDIVVKFKKGMAINEIRELIRKKFPMEVAAFIREQHNTSFVDGVNPLQTSDLARIKRNVAKMVDMDAPEGDIDGYIASEGVTVDDVRNFKDQDPVPQKSQRDTPEMARAEEALRNAHLAGDVEAARKIANFIREQRNHSFVDGSKQVLNDTEVEDAVDASTSEMKPSEKYKGVCDPSHPVYVSYKNNSSEVIEYIEIEFSARLPQHSSNILDWNSGIKSDRIVSPGQTGGYCSMLPIKEEFKNHYNLRNAIYESKIRLVRFQNE